MSMGVGRFLLLLPVAGLALLALEAGVPDLHTRGPALMAVTVGPAGSGAAYAEPADVPWESLPPGSHVAIAPGTYRGTVLIRARGTIGQPIRIDAAAGAVIGDSLVFEEAGYVILRGLAVTRTPLSGIIIRRGSHHITVEGVRVEKAGLGIWIGDGAGTGHRLTGNTLVGNATHGIAIDKVNAAADDPTVIAGNVVAENGYHGIEINGSAYVVERNVVRANGQARSGTSGIHVYAQSEEEDAGDRNVIRYNLSSDARDASGQDGNGIQIDQWCDDNIVAFNVVFDNDGAGLNVFDGMRNTLANNTAYANMRDPGGSHAYPAEIVVASDYTRRLDRARGNRIVDNIAVATRPRVAPLYVEATSTGNGNVFGPNLLFNEAGGPLLVFGRETAGTAAGIAAVSRGAVSARIERPAFVDPADPAGGGLALRQAATHPGAPLAGTVDAKGRIMPDGLSVFGAYVAP